MFPVSVLFSLSTWLWLWRPTPRTAKLPRHHIGAAWIGLLLDGFVGVLNVQPSSASLGFSKSRKLLDGPTTDPSSEGASSDARKLKWAKVGPATQKVRWLVSVCAEVSVCGLSLATLRSVTLRVWWFYFQQCFCLENLKFHGGSICTLGLLLRPPYEIWVILHTKSNDRIPMTCHALPGESWSSSMVPHSTSADSPSTRCITRWSNTVINKCLERSH